MSDGVFYSEYLCLYVPITTNPPFNNTNFQLLSGNVTQNCDNSTLGDLSDYKVVFGELTWVSGRGW